MTNGAPSLVDLTNALAPINSGFPTLGRLLGWLLDCSLGNVIFRDFQSMNGLCCSNQERPRMTGFDGVLIILKIIRLLWSLNATSIGSVHE